MIQMFTKKRNKKGFTLIELVVVIAILGILAALAIPRLTKATDSAKVSAHNANVSAVKSAAAIYIANNPDASGEITAGVAPYMEGGVMPDVPGVATSNPVLTAAKAGYTVTLTADGDITVSPGPAKIN